MGLLRIVIAGMLLGACFDPPVIPVQDDAQLPGTGDGAIVDGATALDAAVLDAAPLDAEPTVPLTDATPGTVWVAGISHYMDNRSTTDHVVDTPTGTIAGDLLVMILATRSSHVVTWPSDFSELSTHSRGMQLSVATMTATGNIPTSFTAVTENFEKIRISVVTLRGVGGMPIGGISDFSERDSHPIADSIDAESDKSVVLAFFGYERDGNNFTLDQPAGFTGVLDPYESAQNMDLSLYLAFRSSTVSGATGPADWGNHGSSDGNWIAYQLEVK